MKRKKYQRKIMRRLVPIIKRVEYNQDLKRKLMLLIWMRFSMKKSQTKNHTVKINLLNMSPQSNGLFEIIITYRLQLLDIKNIRLQNIYNDDIEELHKNVALGK